jgi:hypothetical protein
VAAKAHRGSVPGPHIRWPSRTVVVWCLFESGGGLGFPCSSYEFSCCATFCGALEKLLPTKCQATSPQAPKPACA